MEQLIICCIAFFFAGVVDAITGGGGLITIPAMLAVGIPVHYITGTNQCSVIIGTGVVAYKYAKSGNVHFRSTLITIPFSIIGAYLGARLNLLVPEQYLKIFMLVMVPVIAAFVFANKKLGEEDGIAEKSPQSVALWSAVIGLTLGAYHGFYGPGSGLFFMLAYAVFLKLDLVKATGNTRIVLAIASITSVSTYAMSGAVMWDLALWTNVFYIAGSYLGAVLTIKNGTKVIRPVMFVVVALLIIKLVFDIFVSA